ncbi:extracellular solute-binding protein [Paenibacillus sp. GXUN7292]|uniref:extracellular solute-binding protein n=1 Tax=Paenibacillus sp. GXUN7292 TaxID=3422499 RepID=UPI003D7E569D
MGKFKRKGIVGSIVFILLLGLLAGCGSEPAKEPAKEPTKEPAPTVEGTNTAATPEMKVAEKIKISWVAGQSMPVDEDAEMVKYWEEKLNIELDVWNIENTNYTELLNLKFASGDIPDRMAVRSVVDLQKYADQDILAEIPLDMLKKHAPNTYAKTEEAFPDAFNYAKINGKLYGIPTLNFYNSEFRSPIVWRGDWLKNVGIDKAPETLEEFEDALHKIANEDPDNNGKKDTYGLSSTALNMIYGAFGYIPEIWSEKDGKLVYGAVQPEMKEALSLLNKWYDDGIIDPEFVTGENKGGYWALSHSFINGQIGLSSIGLFYHWKPILFEGDGASHNFLELQKVDPKAADALLHGLPPKSSDGKMGTVQGSPISKFISFGKHLEKEPEKLARILEVIEEISASTYENYVTAMYGIEGKHWEFDANKMPALKNGLTSQDLEKMGANNVMESLELPEFTAIRNEISANWATDNHYAEGGMVNKLLAPLPSQGKYLTELNKIREEAYISIITGDKPIDYFDDFVKSWRSNGGDKLEQEANEWWQSIQ